MIILYVVVDSDDVDFVWYFCGLYFGLCSEVCFIECLVVVIFIGFVEYEVDECLLCKWIIFDV